MAKIQILSSLLVLSMTSSLADNIHHSQPHHGLPYHQPSTYGAPHHPSPAYAPQPHHSAPAYGKPAKLSYAPHPKSHQQDQYAEPKDYAYGYKVNEYDAYGNPNIHSKHEERNGYEVKGQYTVQLPDCRTQIVDYYVDEYKQFHADVKYEGEICYDKVEPKGAHYSAPHAKPAYKQPLHYAPTKHAAPHSPIKPLSYNSPIVPAPYQPAPASYKPEPYQPAPYLPPAYHLAA